jgi:hypothetical protein
MTVFRSSVQMRQGTASVRGGCARSWRAAPCVDRFAASTSTLALLTRGSRSVKQYRWSAPMAVSSACRARQRSLTSIRTHRADEAGESPSSLYPHHAARQRRRGVKTIECYLPEDDIAEIHGVLVTVPGRSAIDLLRTQFRPYALASTDALHRAGLIDINDVDQRVNRLKGFPGIVQARALARMIDGRRESRGESWTFLRMVDAGFPWPEPQIPLLDKYGNELYRVDLGYRELKIGGEFNGREFHSEDDRDHDEARLADMQKRFGWRVATATFESIMGTAADFEWQLGTWLGLNPLPRSW